MTCRTEVIPRCPDNLLIPTILLCLSALVIGFVPIPSDPDLWFHLADGDRILSQGRVPQTDPFSFTRAGQLWVPHSWLFDVGAAWSWRHLGPRATEALMAAVFMVTMVISFALLTARGVHPLGATALCILLAIAAGNTRGVRPQVFTLLLSNLVILLLVQHRYRPRWRMLAYLPAVFLLWAQLHSACIVGLIAVALWLSGRALEAMASRSVTSHRRELVIGSAALALSIPAVFVTPHRINHFSYVALTMGLQELKRTAEWRAPRLLTLEVPDIYIYILVGGLLFLAVRRWRPSRWGGRIGWAEAALCGAMVVLGLTGVRHIPLACVASVPLMADLLTRRGVAPRRDYVPAATRLHIRPIAVAAVLALALLLGLRRYPMDVQSRYTRAEPVNGARALANLARPLRVFTTYNTGSYVLWAGPGRLRVFVDSRADVYGDDLLAAAYRAMNGEGWDGLFARWQVDAAVVQRWDTLAGILVQQQDWVLLAEDRSALTFIRSSMPGGRVARESLSDGGFSGPSFGLLAPPVPRCEH